MSRAIQESVAADFRFPTLVSIDHAQTARGMIWTVYLDTGDKISLTTMALLNYSQFRRAALRQCGIDLVHMQAAVWRARIDRFVKRQRGNSRKDD
jgi:hypothetical protein